MHGALIGYGVIAEGHHDAYLKYDGLDIIAIVDPNEQRRARARGRDPNLRLYASLADLLAAEQIDFIDICTPPNYHLNYMVEGIKAGCHVLCEKPFLLHPKQFDILLDSHRANTRPFIYPSHNYKFSPVMRRLISRAKSEQFGRLVRGSFLTMRTNHAVGALEWYPDWRRDLSYSGGGILQDHATHSIYLAAHLCGAPPDAVVCTTGTMRNDRFASTEDTAFITLIFPDDVQIRLDLTWAAGFRYTSYTVMGSRQNMIVENDFMILTQCGQIRREEIASQFDDPSHKTWFGDMFSDFRACVDARVRQRELLIEAWIACAAIDAAYVSAQEGGRRVAVAPPPAALRFLEEPA